MQIYTALESQPGANTRNFALAVYSSVVVLFNRLWISEHRKTQLESVLFNKVNVNPVTVPCR